MLGASKDVNAAGTATIDGVPITHVHGTSMRFTSINKPVTVKAPPASEVSSVPGLS